MPDQTTIPQYHALLWPTLQALQELGGSGTISEVVDKMVELEGFSEAQQSVPHGDGPTSEIAYRAAWARTYLKKVGAVDNSTRGVWAITEQGRKLTADEMAEIPRAVRAMTLRSGSRTSVAGTDDAPAGSDVEDLEDAWREKVLEAILAAPADAFERLTQRLLREADFVSVQVTGAQAIKALMASACTGCRWSASPCSSSASAIEAVSVPELSGTSEER